MTGPAWKYLYVADSANGRICALRRAAPTGSRWASSGAFAAWPAKWIHNLAIDAEGNLFTSQVRVQEAVQKFVRNRGGL